MANLKIHDFKQKWIAAAISEYQSMIRQGVWELVPKP
jgi:hypothetical protein